MNTKTVKTALIAALWLVFLAGASAQPAARREQAKERVAAARIGFLTHKLKLTPLEAQKFWPLYEAYHDELAQVDREPLRGLRRAAEDPERWAALTEKEAEELMRRHAKALDDKERIRKAYHTKFLEALPAKKVLMLYVAEVQFKEAMLDKLRERQGAPRAGGTGEPGGPGGGRPGPRPGRPGPPATEPIWE